MNLAFKRGFNPDRLTWGRPDSVATAICSYCAGGLGQVPLILSTPQGFTIRLCDECTKKWITVLK